MKATLQDIADKTGLSVSTVSRVLRGESKTANDRVEQVISAAQELNYQFDTRLLNNAYSFKRKIHVAVVTNFFREEFYASLFKGLSEAAYSMNTYMSLFDIDKMEDGIPDFLSYLSKNSVDAVILFVTTLEGHQYLQPVERLPKDFIVVSVAPSFNPVLDTVTFDSYRGGYIVAQHFDDKRFTDVGLITGPMNKYEALLRKNGFSDYVNHKSDMELVWSYTGDYSLESGKRAYVSYKTSARKPRAIFGSNDYMCVGFIQEALKDGVRIPEDLAIAGFDDIKISSYINPSLTSVHTDYKELGIAALELINDKLRRGDHHKGTVSLIPVNLEVREST